MSVSIAIRCDGCGVLSDKPEHGANRPPGHALRREAKETGWVVSCIGLELKHHTGSMDFCPKCVAEFNGPEPLTDNTGCDV